MEIILLPNVSKTVVMDVNGNEWDADGPTAISALSIFLDRCCCLNSYSTMIKVLSIYL